jgi:hypothetical protein
MVTLAFCLTNELVWTLCLMHRCVCIWWYILQNYSYKLHFQNLSIYHIPHVSIGTLANENLDVCTACDPWNSNIQLTMEKDQRHLLLSHLDLHLEVFIPRSRRKLLQQEEDGESQNTFSRTGWMTWRMDGKSFPTTMSFTICNKAHRWGRTSLNCGTEVCHCLWS